MFAVLPQIHPFSFDESVNSGDVVSITCFVSKGDLPLNITWTLNGQKVHILGGIDTVSTNRRTSQLTIESVQDHHSGEYACMAQNIVGTTKHLSHLNVNGIKHITFCYENFSVLYNHYCFPISNCSYAFTSVKFKFYRNIPKNVN